MTTSRHTVLAALIEAGADGMNVKQVAEILGADGGRGGSSLAYANAGRMVKQLVGEGLAAPVDGVKGRWHATGTLDDIVVRPKHPGALLDKLPDAPSDAKPPPSRDADRERAERIQRLKAAIDRVKGSAGPEELSELQATIAVHGIDDWNVWLPAMFPRIFSSPFGPHHEEFWQWVWEIEADQSQDPFIGVWNRGGAKSASAETACVALAARQRRKYALYVSGTQNQADEHVGNIGSLLESPELTTAYPALGQRAVTQFGASKGWRRNRLRTAAGFTVDALGLDTAARGARIDEQRPDLIVLDDVDSENDTPATVDKKIRTITRKLLPAGSKDSVVLAIQNIIHSNSIFARLAKLPGAPSVDFLAHRRISGPIPAVWDMEWAQDGDSYRITGGRPSWPGLDIEACQVEMDRIGLTAFLIECQHEEADLSGGMFDHLDFDALTVTAAQVPVLRKIGCWVDPAVTSTKRSDSCGIVIDGLGVDRHYYRLWSWERVTSPVEALKVAILAAIEFGATVVGVETDQGGDTWKVVYQRALQELMESGEIVEGARIPRFESAKAGTTQLSKNERAARMLADYELGRFRHVQGGCGPLQSGLRRFPLHKPYDCVDAAYWSWRWLAESGGERQGGFRTRAPRGTAAEVTVG